MIVLAVILLMVSLVRYSRIRSNFPAGMTIASVPVGGLDTQEATDRLLQVYASALELRSGETVIQVKPILTRFRVGYGEHDGCGRPGAGGRTFLAGILGFPVGTLPEYGGYSPEVM